MNTTLYGEVRDRPTIEMVDELDRPGWPGLRFGEQAVLMADTYLPATNELLLCQARAFPAGAHPVLGPTKSGKKRTVPLPGSLRGPIAARRERPWSWRSAAPASRRLWRAGPPALALRGRSVLAGTAACGVVAIDHDDGHTDLNVPLA